MKPVVGLLAVAGLVYRAWSRKSLTPLGLVVAGASAAAHALHPWSTPIALLAVFYYGGTKVTRVKHEIKAQKTLSATGSEGGEGPRNHIQVLANSVVATVLSIAHAVVLSKSSSNDSCFSLGQSPADILMVGIVANYAAVAADTFSSELESCPSRTHVSSHPVLSAKFPGTNGGVTAAGLGAGLLGSFTIALTSALILPFCPTKSGLQDRALWTVAMTFWGLLGSVLDSVLGGLLQASVVDKRSGKVVEGSGGRKVLIHPGSTKPAGTSGNSPSAEVSGSTHLRNTEAVANAATLRGSRVTGTSAGIQPGRPHYESHESRRLESGRDWLDNNGVNILMAVLMSMGAMGISQWVWGIDVQGVVGIENTAVPLACLFAGEDPSGSLVY